VQKRHSFCDGFHVTQEDENRAVLIVVCTTPDYFQITITLNGFISLFRILNISRLKILITPITVAARSKALTFFAHSNTGIVGSDPSRGMDMCVRLLCFCFPVWRWRPCDGLISSPRSPTNSVEDQGTQKTNNVQRSAVQPLIDYRKIIIFSGIHCVGRQYLLVYS
jgi:hypothetical protein